MATWVTHLMIADEVLTSFPQLDKRGFRIGNIAPDCNVENEDWSAFTPSREITHWMTGERKTVSDCDAFCQQYILNRQNPDRTSEEYAFLLGYYAHLITDAAFQSMIRNEDRVKAVWSRIHANNHLSERSVGMNETWDSVKKLIPKHKRMAGIYTIEADYLQKHPQCGYLTDVLPLQDFPDYIDYLPAGAIARKVAVMGYLPKPDPNADFVALSRAEYAAFCKEAVSLISERFIEQNLLAFG